jgi:hypothetical protein
VAGFCKSREWIHALILFIRFLGILGSTLLTWSPLRIEPEPGGLGPDECPVNRRCGKYEADQVPA